MKKLTQAQSQALVQTILSTNKHQYSGCTHRQRTASTAPGMSERSWLMKARLSTKTIPEGYQRMMVIIQKALFQAATMRKVQGRRKSRCHNQTQAVKGWIIRSQGKCAIRSHWKNKEKYTLGSTVTHKSRFRVHFKNSDFFEPLNAKL